MLNFLFKFFRLHGINAFVYIHISKNSNNIKLGNFIFEASESPK